MDQLATGLDDVNVLDTTQLPTQVQHFYEQILRWGQSAPATVDEAYLHLASNGQVRSFIADHPELNAWATANSDGFVVGLYAGTPIILHFVFNHLLRFPFFLPMVGQPEQEVPERGGYSHGVPLVIPEALSVQEACTALPGVSRPTDDDRAAAASALTEIACAFAMFHEVAHIIAGHAGYLRAQHKHSLLELFPRTAQSMSTQMLRVWEYEADKIASVMLLSFLVDEHNRGYFADVFQMPSESAEHRVSRLTSIGVAASYVLFLLLGQRHDRLELSGAHPHPLVRMTSIHHAMRLAARDDLGVPEARLDHDTDQMTTDVYTAWDQLGIPVPSLRRKSFLPRHLIVRKQIEKLQSEHTRLMGRYGSYSWLPDDAWKAHDS